MIKSLLNRGGGGILHVSILRTKLFTNWSIKSTVLSIHNFNFILGYSFRGPYAIKCNTKSDTTRQAGSSCIHDLLDSNLGPRPAADCHTSCFPTI